MLPLRKIIQEALVFAENLQQAEKIYFKPGKLSPEVKKYITHITGGDAYTKIITDIYYAMLQQSIIVSRTVLSGFDGEEEEVDPRDKPGQLYTSNDLLHVDDWKKVRAYHNQLKEYNKNLFPIKGFNINGVQDIWDFIRSLNERATILTLIKQLPSIATRNLAADFRKERNSDEFQQYRSDLSMIVKGLAKSKDKVDPRMFEFVLKKMFSSKNKTIQDVVDFVEQKENLLGGIEVTKKMVKDAVSEHSYDLEIVYSKGNIMVVEVTSPHGMHAIGCTSLWCFTNKSWDTFNQYAHNGFAYVIIDFSKKTDDAEFMYTLIKPLDYTSDEDGENDHKLYDMSNEEVYAPLGVIGKLIGLDKAENVFLFGEEPLSPQDKILAKHQGEKSPWPYQDPNQTKLDLKEFRMMVREVLVNEAKKSKFKKLEDNKVPLTDEERKQVMDADAVWNHGPGGKPSPAVWKSKDKDGKITYVTNTHRAFQARPTLKGAISIYHSFIKGTS